MGAYPPPPQPPPFGNDWRLQRRMLREQQRFQRDVYRANLRARRRPSIVGPILVIAVGVLFLLAQLGRLPWNGLLAFFAHWWPLLLVLVGVVRLVEWVLDRSAQQDIDPDAAPGTVPQPRMLGGGVITLLVLLAAGGIIASIVVRHGPNAFSRNERFFNQDDLDEFLGDKHESDQTLVQAMPAGAGLTVDLPRGDLFVNGTSSDGQLHLDLHKEVFTRSDNDASRKAETLSPQIRTEGDRVVVTVPNVDGARANLTLTLPQGTVINATANRGDIHVSHIVAPVTVTANHGDVDLDSISGPVTVHTNNGDSSVSAAKINGPFTISGHAKDVTTNAMRGPVNISGEFFGTTHLERVSAPVQFHTSRTDLQLNRLDGQVEISSSSDLSADQVVGPMVLNTRNRNITLERVAGDVSVTNRNGSVDLVSAPPIGNIAIENRNGSVNVTLPTNASFTVQADTANGDLETEFSLPKGGNENHPSLSGSIGTGGPLVRVSTSQGDIALKKSQVAPLPAMPPIPPMPPRLSSLPKEAQDAIRDAQREAQNAQKEVQAAASEAQKEARAATLEGQKEAQAAAREAQKESQAATREAQKEAQAAARDAQRQAREAREEAARERRNSQKSTPPPSTPPDDQQ